MSLNNVVGSEQNECSEDELISRKELEMMLSPEEVQRLFLAKEKLGQEKLLTNKKRKSENETCTSEPIRLKLQFNPVNISSPVLTGKKIEGEGCASIEVALVDCLTGQVVNSGPEASAKVEIVALEGGFDSVEDDNWTSEEFENKIVREKSLLVGNVNLNLKEGIVTFGEIHLRHTKKYRRNCEFRLGARVVDNLNSIRVKEAKTESFTVKDGRRKYHQKHHPPSPFDEVWRLERIAKDGRLHDRLTEENIKTVADFLTQLSTDPQRLRKILKVGGKSWEVIVGQAQQCRIDKKEVDANVCLPNDVHAQPSTSSPGGLPSFSIEDVSNNDNMYDIDLPLVNQEYTVWDWEALLNDFDQFENPSVEPRANAANGFVDDHDGPIDRAHSGWTMVSSVLRWWFSARFLIKKRTLGLEGIHVEKKQRLS